MGETETYHVHDFLVCGPIEFITMDLDIPNHFRKCKQILETFNKYDFRKFQFFGNHSFWKRWNRWGVIVTEHVGVNEHFRKNGEMRWWNLDKVSKSWAMLDDPEI